MTNFENYAYPSTFTPAVVSTMHVALSDAWKILAANGVHPDVVGEAAVREILAKGIIQIAELGERDAVRLRDAAVDHYLSQSPLI